MSIIFTSFVVLFYIYIVLCMHISVVCLAIFVVPIPLAYSFIVSSLTQHLIIHHKNLIKHQLQLHYNHAFYLMTILYFTFES